MGMAREEYDADSASSQWFWLLFDSDLTPAGKNLLDGRRALTPDPAVAAHCQTAAYSPASLGLGWL